MGKIEKCVICGNKDSIDPNAFIKGNLRSIMEEKDICFTCAIWTEKIELMQEKDEDRIWIVIDHNCMCAHPFLEKEERKGFIGCNGCVQYFEMNDGRLICSNNVWHQGLITEPFRKIIIDNARRLTKEEYEKKIA